MTSLWDVSSVSLPLTIKYIWPYLNDVDVIHGSRINRASCDHLSHYSLKQYVTISQYNWIKRHQAIKFKIENFLHFVGEQIIDETIYSQIKSCTIYSHKGTTLEKFNQTKQFLLKLTNLQSTIIKISTIDIDINQFPLHQFKSLRWLQFPDRFNQIISSNTLPSHLQTLIFSDKFNQDILPHVLPKSLTQLQLGNSFSKSFVFLPHCRRLEKLIVYGPVDKKNLTFPEKLTHLEFHHMVLKPKLKETQFVFPRSLTELILPVTYEHTFEQGLLPNLTSLEYKWTVTINNLKKLSRFIHNEKFNDGIYNLIFLSHIQEIIIKSNNYTFKTSLLTSDTFSNQLLSLTIHRCKEILQNVLPLSLLYLKFSGYYNYPLAPNLLPRNLKHLSMSKDFNHPIENSNILPLSLKTLEFGNDFNQAIFDHILPNSLESLIFGNGFNGYISKHSLPQNLKILTFGIKFIRDKISFELPLQLEQLTLSFWMYQKELERPFLQIHILGLSHEQFHFTLPDKLYGRKNQFIFSDSDDFDEMESDASDNDD